MASPTTVEVSIIPNMKLTHKVKIENGCDID